MEIICLERQCEASTVLADIYLQHSIAMYKTLPQKAHYELSGKIIPFYKALPDEGEFDRSVANAVGEMLGVDYRTISKYLRRLVDRDMLDHPHAKGPFRKK